MTIFPEHEELLYKYIWGILKLVIATYIGLVV